MNQVPILSIVAPCYNEAAGLREFHRRARAAADAVSAGSVEIVLVDDGSRDATWRVIEELAKADGRVLGVRLMRNYGHQAAATAGLTVCSGQRALLIDSDLQDPPELLASMMSAMDEGADVVYGQRNEREAETAFKRVTAFLFYRLLDALSDVAIPRDTGDFRLMSRRVVDALAAMPERQRFIRGMVSWVGGRQVPLRYDRQARHAGRSSYPLFKMLRLALDGITGFSSLPLRLSLYSGLAAAVIALLLLLWTVWRWATGDVVTGWSSLMTAVVFFGAAQLVFIGLVGEYVGRVFQEVKGRPLFLVETLLASGACYDLPPQFAALAPAARRDVLRDLAAKPASPNSATTDHGPPPAPGRRGPGDA
jgi:dolichol-phosphate mannosyltransferase